MSVMNNESNAVNTEAEVIEVAGIRMHAKFDLDEVARGLEYMALWVRALDAGLADEIEGDDEENIMEALRLVAYLPVTDRPTELVASIVDSLNGYCLNMMAGRA